MKKMFLFLFLLSLCSSEIFSQASFSTGALEIAVNVYGRIRLYTPDGVRHLQRGSILVATSETEVFDYQNDADIEDSTKLIASPQLSDFEIYGAYNNEYSALPPNVLVKLNAYGWTNGNYVIVKFTIVSRESASINAAAGLDIIPELGQTYGFDTVTYNNSEKVIRFHRGSDVNMGIKLLSAELSSLYSFEWYSGYMVDTSYWNWMNFGSIQPQYVSNTLDGPVTITSQLPVTLNNGDSMVVFYAFALGADENEMMAGISSAVQKFNTIFTSVDDNFSTISSFILNQNYPNPFNPTTNINFYLTKNSFVTLKIYDVLGNETATLINSEMGEGEHNIVFNANNLSSGLYFYTLKADNQIQTRKMILIK